MLQQLVEIPKLTVLIPTFHGDIRLDKQGKKTRVRVHELTPSEERAMESLRSRAVSTRLRNKWATAAEFLALTNSAYRSKDGVTIVLDAPIEKVQAVLAKALKPERKLLTAVRFSDGRVEEVHSNLVDKTPEGETVEAKPEAEKADKPEKPEKAAVATTLAQPVRGCPMPDFPEADIRASRLLESFLSPNQIDDFRRSGCFVTIGADSGHRYLIGSRERPSALQRHLGGRQLFDLEEKRSICVHDWDVPPAEEMLALHLCLSLPGREAELLTLPEIEE